MSKEEYDYEVKAFSVLDYFDFQRVKSRGYRDTLGIHPSPTVLMG